MTDTVLSLGDIPDLSGISDGGADSTPFSDGWYEGVILAKREFTDRNGNDRLFESGDTPSKNGDSRNAVLQVEVTRASDKRKMNTKIGINYREVDFAPETLQAIVAAKEAAKASGERPQWGSLFRSFMALKQLGQLQGVAGVKTFARNDTGGLNLAPAYGKPVFVRLAPDDQNPLYKQVADFRATKPAKAAVL